MESGSTYGWFSKRLADGVITLAVLLLAGGAGAANQIDSCTTFFSPGEYVLTSNIIYSGASSCINITSSDVIFDGSGFTIDGSERSNYGVYVHNPATALTNVTIRNLNVTDWYSGIYYDNTSNGTISGNNVSNNVLGIVLTSSSNNTLTSNNILNDGDGIDIFSSSNYNILKGNTISNNKGGIFLRHSNNNDLSGNIVSNNRGGINLISSSNNTIYNNLFNNSDNFRIDDSINRWNIIRTKAPNIIKGSYLSGNVWSNLEGTGASQTCEDGEGDGICDSSYRLDDNNIDYLPLIYEPAIIESEVTRNTTATIPSEVTRVPTAGATQKAAGFEMVQATITFSAIAYIFWRKKRCIRTCT